MNGVQRSFLGGPSRTYCHVVLPCCTLLPAIPNLLYPTPALTPQALMYVCPNEALAMIVGLGSTFILDLFDGYVIA